MQKIVILFILSFLSTHVTYSQSKEDDLLQSLVTARKLDRDSIYFELFRMFRTTDSEKALMYALKTYTTSKENHNELTQVRSCNALGYLYNAANDFNQADKYYKEGLDVANQNKFDEFSMYILNNMGILHFNYDNYGQAIKNYLASLSLAKKLNDFDQQAFLYNNIGLVYYRLKYWEEAMRNFDFCVKLKNEHNITAGLDKNNINIGLVLLNLNRYNEAADIFNNVLSKCEDCDNTMLLDCYEGLGRAYLFNKDYLHAQEFFDKGNTLSKSSGEDRYLATSINNLAEIKIAQNEYDEAFRLLNESVDISKRIGSLSDLQTSYKLLTQLFTLKKDFESALKYNGLYGGIKDSLFNESVSNTLRDSYVDFNENHNREVIKKKNTLLRVKDQTTIQMAVITFLAICLCFLVYANLKKQKKLKEVLNAQLQDSRYEMDHFLYRTSHDIKGPLATLIGLASLLLLPTEVDNSRVYILSIKETALKLNGILIRITTISNIKYHQLKYTNIFIAQLAAELMQASQARFNHGPLMSLECKGIGVVNADREMLQIVLGNLIDNAVQFSETSIDKKIIVSSEKVGAYFEISVSDYGIGVSADQQNKIFDLFSIGPVSKGAGLGLYLARQAVQKMNGLISVFSLSNPTIIKISIPVEKVKGSSVIN